MPKGRIAVVRKLCKHLTAFQVEALDEQQLALYALTSPTAFTL